MPLDSCLGQWVVLTPANLFSLFANDLVGRISATQTPKGLCYKLNPQTVFMFGCSAAKYLFYSLNLTDLV